MKQKDGMSWIRDESKAHLRSWEEFYRNRWQHDKIIRSTHGVNCTGGCTWQIYVKDGIVTWEMQGLDYPSLEAGLPPYEPRGCQRGISFSWYLYSPLRVKYPYLRGALLDLWKQARAKFDDPVEAWRSLVENPEARQRWQRARGKGGFRRGDWDTALELIAASCVYTARKHGPDRIAGFSPIPAMSMISYAAGARFLQLMGGVSLSFYDWYCDLPPRFPRNLGRADRRAGVGRLVQRQAAGGDGLEPEHDPHAGLPLRRRGAAQRHARCGSSRRISTRWPSTPMSGCASTPARTAPGGWP